MNEKIKKLAIQAGFEYDPRDCNFYHGDSAQYLNKELIKFAELIVGECIGCCEQVISDPVPESVDTWLNGGEQCIQEIKEHFGVK